METKNIKMSTKRKHIDTFRQMLKERNIDTNYTNQYLYNVLFDQAKWLIKREINNGNIHKNPKFLQTLSCWDIVESSTVEDCCPVNINCKIYRTKHQLPEMWQTANGPAIFSVTSVDSTTNFFITNYRTWQSKRNDPYHKMQPTKYVFYENGYLWFPEFNPHKVNIRVFAVDDVRLMDIKCEDCDSNENECIQFLETEFLIPDWVEAEMYAKALQLIVPLKQLPEDQQIDKNTNRKL